MGTAVDTDSANVGLGGRKGNPEYSKTALPAATGLKLVRSIMAKAQPISPELNSCWVGGQLAFGSRGWNAGTVQLKLRSPERLEMGRASEARSISFSAESKAVRPANETT